MFLSIHDENMFQPLKGVERRCWLNSLCRGVLLVLMIVGQGPIALAVGAGGFFLDIFSLIYLFFLPLFGRRPNID